MLLSSLSSMQLPYFSKSIRLFLGFLFSMAWFAVSAQQPNEEETGLRNFLERGKFELHARTFFMSTINKNELPDFSTLGFGAGLGYQTPYFKNFKIGFSGFFVWQLYEHNLSTQQAQNGSRYELTLYDMYDPQNNKNLDRLEELYLEYKNKNLKLVLGRQIINSPLLNAQDNRMRPNLFSGLMAGYEADKLKLEGGWLTAVSPRGTIDWYSIEESFGVYPFGRDLKGEASGYKNNISSKGIGLAGIKYNAANSNHQLWNYYAENVFNISFAQTDYSLAIGNPRIILGAQGFYQTAVGSGGNADADLAYMPTGNKSYGLGFRTGLQNGGHQLTLNYLGISSEGRFLFPREWGREIFYAGLARERYEGNGGLSAYTLNYQYSVPGKFNTLIGLGKADFPDVNNYQLNKYGVPSYYHFVGRVGYDLKGFLKGTNIVAQAVHKKAQNPGELTSRDFLNRVDMWNLSLVVDIDFDILNRKTSRQA